MISVVRLPDRKYALAAPSYSPMLAKVARIVPGMVRADAKSYRGYPDAIEVAAGILKANKLLVGGETLDPSAWGEPLAAPSLKDLRDYQKTGVKFLLTHAGTGALLADDMGLGKTAQAIRAARAWRAKTVVIAPKIVRTVWTEEAAMWWPDAPVEVLEGKPRPIGLEPCGIAIIHYDILHAWVAELNRWGVRLAVFDECHALMTSTSKRSQAAAAIEAPLRVGLSGTPMTNRPSDLWNVVNTLSPGRFGKEFFAFGVRYSDGHKEEVTPTKTVWKFDGVSRPEELKRRLEWMMLRRTTEEVHLELPPIVRQILWLEGQKNKKWQPPGSLKALRGLLERAADRKMPEVLPIIEAAREACGGTVVVFCHRRAVAEWYRDELRLAGVERVEMIHGGLPVLTRTKRLEEAKNWGSGGILVVTIDSCGVGISLAFARAAVFAEITYEPWKLRQAERRVARFGQKAGSVLIQYPLARGTVDELILDKVISKLDVEGDLGLGDGGKMRGDVAPSGEAAEERVLKELFDF